MVDKSRQRATGRYFCFIAVILVFALTVSASFPDRAGAQTFSGDSAMSGDVRIALQNLEQDIASEADRALLFANNDAINAAGQNGTIPESTYIKAQNDYQSINRDFAEASAIDAKAKFTVQTPSSDNPIPGTDSDYITRVNNKNQILEMQEGYNRRVNEFMKEIPEDKRPKARDNWHNKLDTDFMADPDLVTDPAEFREIAKMNNDAYKNRFAAEYERLSRAKDGSKIGPNHVNGYMEEMNDFAQKKGRKVQEILAKPASHLSDPKETVPSCFKPWRRSRNTHPVWNRLTISCARRRACRPATAARPSPSSGRIVPPATPPISATPMPLPTRRAFPPSRISPRTMAEVSKKNPHFNASAADDIARIVESLPPGRRASALSRISAGAGPGLVDDIVRTSVRAGRLPPGAGSLADDLVRMNTDGPGPADQQR